MLKKTEFWHFAVDSVAAFHGASSVSLAKAMGCLIPPILHLIHCGTLAFIFQDTLLVFDQLFTPLTLCCGELCCERVRVFWLQIGSIDSGFRSILGETLLRGIFAYRSLRLSSAVLCIVVKRCKICI